MADNVYEDLKRQPGAKEFCEPCGGEKNIQKNATHFCNDCREYYCPPCRAQHVRFKMSMGHRVIRLDTKQDEEKNVYDTVQGEAFDVVIKKTNASNRCGLSGKYKLLILSDNLSLLDHRTSAQLYTWPFLGIRRFAVEPKKSLFLFESGRRCASGEGEFQFKSPTWYTIYVVTAKRNEDDYERRIYRP